MSNPEFYNCSIINNIGLVFDENDFNTYAKFRNSIIHGNSVAEIRHASNNGLPSIKYSLAQDVNLAADGNIEGTTVNLRFVKPLPHSSASKMLDDYRLKCYSKLIDSCDIYSMSIKDFSSNGRTFGQIPNIGVFEY